VNGNIKAKTAVELCAPARVRGDIETPSFSMEKGVVFQGQSTMPVESASSAASRPVAVVPARNGDGRSVPAPVG
jgi:cytoskeletal protein CcmA (bactofilin family)